MTTTPTASPELPDLDRLEALARAATPGPWSLAKVIDRSIEHLCPVDRDRLSLLTVVHEGETPYGAVFRDEDAKFMAGIHPEQVLALIALARAALAHQPAQEQASTTRVTETKRAQLEARGYEVVGYVMQNSVNELCTLAHGRVEWLGKGTVTDYGTPAQQEPVAAPQQGAAHGAQVDRWSWSKRGMELDPNGHYAAYSAPGTPEAADEAHKGAALWRATLRACGGLPDGYEVRIELENGCGMVVWYDERGERHVIDGEGYLSDDVNEAIDLAIQRAAAPKGGA